MVEFIDDDIKEVMEITGYTKEKATKLFKSVAKDIDDGTDDELCSYDVIDVIKMEHKAKVNGSKNVGARSDTPKEKPKREIKPDETKVHFLSVVLTFLEGLELNGKISNVKVLNPQKELSFNIGADTYSLNLVKHRPPKKKTDL